MNIYPAIDLKSGACVRLYQGCYDKVTVYQKDPVLLAQSFAEQGARILHVVDLDGAKQGSSINLDLIEKITKESGLQIQTGGGIRTEEQIRDLLNKNIARVVLGSVAVLQPNVVKNWLQEFGGEKIVLALDIRMDENNFPKLALHGWQTESEKNLWDLLDEYQDTPLKHVLCTDIHQDGTLQGPNLKLYQDCVKRYSQLHFQASGGIGHLKDLRELSAVPVAGVIVGKALYENKFTLPEALNEVTVC